MDRGYPLLAPVTPTPPNDVTAPGVMVQSNRHEEQYWTNVGRNSVFCVYRVEFLALFVHFMLVFVHNIYFTSLFSNFTRVKEGEFLLLFIHLDLHCFVCISILMYIFMYFISFSSLFWIIVKYFTAIFLVHICVFQNLIGFHPQFRTLQVQNSVLLEIIHSLVAKA